MDRRLCSLALTGALGAALVAVACSKNNPAGPPPPTVGHAQLRFVNALPSVSSVDAYRDTVRVTTDLPYDRATSYLTVDTGTKTVKITAAGTTTALVSVPATLITGHTYTFLAIGPSSAMTGVLAFDSNTAPISPAIKLRLIHAAPSVASFDIYATGVTDTLPTAPTRAGVAFGTVLPYLTLAPGTYRIRFTAAGTKTVALDDTLPTLNDGAVRTVAALDFPGGGAPVIALNLPDAR